MFSIVARVMIVLMPSMGIFVIFFPFVCDSSICGMILSEIVRSFEYKLAEVGAAIVNNFGQFVFHDVPKFKRT